MSRMIRKQVYITPEQEAFLKRRSRELGVTEAELIRRAIDAFLDEFVELPGSDAANATIYVMEERARIAEAQAARDWTREDLYAERLDRYGSDGPGHERSGLRS